MFEDFRKQAEQSDFPEENPETALRKAVQKPRSDYFLGMTPVQRFVVSLMLLFMTILLGILFLLVTSRIVPPFLG